ncbi:MAG: hypothetical protein KUG82_21435 [Pseudomonadales bacterium]|nr:hypothetical protein [Pseudomonadales bacterium]
MNQMKSVPYFCAFEQGSSVASWGSVGIRSAFPFLRPKENPSFFNPVLDLVSPPSSRLIEHYIEWTGASQSKYQDEVPPHLFSQWSIPLVTRVLLQARYPLKDIINQGCSIKINARIPRGEKLWLTARLINLVESGDRIRFSVQVSTSTSDLPNAIVAVFNLVLLPEMSETKERNKSSRIQGDFFESGHWSADDTDGFRYALLTGDFNPIHWIDPVAKRSSFGGKVLHGFASLCRTWESLESSKQDGGIGRDSNKRIEQISVKFLQPVRLPSTELKVMTSVKTNKEGDHRLRVRGKNNHLHLAGKFKMSDNFV